MDRRAVLAAALVASSCADGPPPVVLATAGDRIVSASVAGRDPEWLRGQLGKSVRLSDAEWRAIPAGAPSRIVFDLELPAEAELHFARAVADDREASGSVEFAVSLETEGRQRVLHRSSLDPARHKEQRGFVPASVALGARAGTRARLILETSSRTALGEPRAALWGDPVVTARDRGEPLVIVYLVDTLRADHASVYGYHRATTPRLAELARDSVVFDNAVAQSSWTRPSVGSLFTSLLPAQHGAVFVRSRLPAEVETLAELLDARGFATAAAISNAVVSGPRTGFAQGFQTFLERRPVAEDTVDSAIGRLAAMAGRPAFLYVHTMDPHMPYTPPEPWRSMFDPKPTEQVPGRNPRQEQDAERNRDSYVARYDGEVAYGDMHFGRLIDALRRRGLYERALIVFLSDHGEELLDHGGWGHGLSLYEELVRIPLVVKFPAGRDGGRRVSRLVQEIDVLPTILRELGLPIPGHVLGSPLQEVEARGERQALMEVSHRGKVVHGIRGSREKYLRRFSPQYDELFFDLASDPTEQHDALASLGERLRKLRAGIGPGLRPNPFHHVVRCVGPGAFDLRIDVAGWLEDLQTDGHGPDASPVLSPDRDSANVRCRPGPNGLSEFRLVARPRGTRVTLSGTRDGRPLRAAEVWLGGLAVPARELPAVLPDLDNAQDFKPFAPRESRRPGVYSWIEVPPGGEAIELDSAAEEQLRALGYIQ